MQELEEEGRQATTSVNAFELFYGAYRSAQRQKNVDRAKALLDRLDVLPFERSSADVAGEILAGLSSIGNPIDFRDVMIAGIVKSSGFVLVTRNRTHFSRVNGLKLESW